MNEVWLMTKWWWKRLKGGHEVFTASVRRGRWCCFVEDGGRNMSEEGKKKEVWSRGCIDDEKNRFCVQKWLL